MRTEQEAVKGFLRIGDEWRPIKFVGNSGRGRSYQRFVRTVFSNKLVKIPRNSNDVYVGREHLVDDAGHWARDADGHRVPATAEEREVDLRKMMARREAQDAWRAAFEMPKAWEFETSRSQKANGSTVHTVSFDGWTDKRTSKSHRYTHAIICAQLKDDGTHSLGVLSWHKSRENADKAMRPYQHMPAWKMMIIGIR